MEPFQAEDKENYSTERAQVRRRKGEERKKRRKNIIVTREGTNEQHKVVCGGS